MNQFFVLAQGTVKTQTAAAPAQTVSQTTTAKGANGAPEQQGAFGGIMGMLPMILIFAGIVYVLETLSDIIQIGSYKLRKKRVFKMAPIHYHFEMSGWSEWKIVIVFCLVGAIGAAISILAVTMI